jgi:molybdopterin-guanine dinucleotide biosynthesis protein
MMAAMRIVSVSGACSRAGKTAVAETFLRALPHGAAAAVKFTTTEDVFERCPRGSVCAVCDIDVPFRIEIDPAVLREPGTDTDRLAAAGARPVVWAIARAAAAPQAWMAVERMLEATPLAILEGSTVVEQGLARAELRLFVAHRSMPPDRWKPTSAALIEAADRVVIHTAGPAPSSRVVDALDALGARDKRVIADATRPLREWAPDLDRRLHALAGAAAAASASP